MEREIEAVGLIGSEERGWEDGEEDKIGERRKEVRAG